MVKKGLFWLVFAFALYSLLTAPETSAEAVRGVGEGLSSAGNAVVRFFDALTP